MTSRANRIASFFVRSYSADACTFDHVFAVFEKERDALADDDGAGIRDRSLDRNSRHRHETDELAGQRAPAEAAADDRQQLPHALHVGIFSVGGLNLQQQHHLQAVMTTVSPAEATAPRTTPTSGM